MCRAYLVADEPCQQWPAPLRTDTVSYLDHCSTYSCAACHNMHVPKETDIVFVEYTGGTGKLRLIHAARCSAGRC